MRISPCLLLLLATPAAAQRLPPAPPRYVAAFRQRPDSQGAAATPRTYAGLGATAGGTIVGLMGIGLGYGLCAQGDNGHPTSFAYCVPRSLLGGLVGATLGAIVGGFIGSAFPRTDSP
ncbi:MAG TPA: hypothetical protein VEV39_06010 [Gemmatimonadales bacterium]|nr:hypothetical protein [Gemmatimonadales bacterium]